MSPSGAHSYLRHWERAEGTFILLERIILENLSTNCELFQNNLNLSILGEKNTFKFEGGDSQVENIIFKSAALGSGASGKHVVEVSAVDANSEKVTAILCILNDQVSHN